MISVVLTSSTRVDINCGCPQEPVMLAGYGSALLARQEWDHLVNMGT